MCRLPAHPRHQTVTNAQGTISHNHNTVHKCILSPPAHTHTPHTDPPTTGHTQAYMGYTFPEAQVHIRPSPDHSAHPLTPPLLQPDTHTLDSRGETHPQQNMFTHDHITQAKDPPDHHLTLAHPRCRERGLAFTHPQVHYIHPSKHIHRPSHHLSPLHSTQGPTFLQILFLARVEQKPLWGSQPAGRPPPPPRASPRGKGEGVPEAASSPLSPPPSAASLKPWLLLLHCRRRPGTS